MVTAVVVTADRHTLCRQAEQLPTRLQALRGLCGSRCKHTAPNNLLAVLSWPGLGKGRHDTLRCPLTHPPTADYSHLPGLACPVRLCRICLLPLLLVLVLVSPSAASLLPLLSLLSACRFVLGAFCFFSFFFLLDDQRQLRSSHSSTTGGT